MTSSEQAGTELSEAFSGLLDEVRAVEEKLRAADPPLAEADLLDGYRLAFSLLRVAVDAYRVERQGPSAPGGCHRALPQVGWGQLRRLLPTLAHRPRPHLPRDG